jgi:hypothetical protein
MRMKMAKGPKMAKRPKMVKGTEKCMEMVKRTEMAKGTETAKGMEKEMEMVKGMEKETAKGMEKEKETAKGMEKEKETAKGMEMSLTVGTLEMVARGIVVKRWVRMRMKGSTMGLHVPPVEFSVGGLREIWVAWQIMVRVFFSLIPINLIFTHWSVEDHEWFTTPTTSANSESGKIFLFTKKSVSCKPVVVKVKIDTDIRELLEEVAILYSPIKSEFVRYCMIMWTNIFNRKE